MCRDLRLSILVIGLIGAMGWTAWSCGSKDGGRAGHDLSSCERMCESLWGCLDDVEPADASAGDSRTWLKECSDECESASDDFRECFADAMLACDFRAAEDCSGESPAEELCREICESVADCSANPEIAMESCNLDCEYEWARPGYDLLNCLKETPVCTEAWDSCFEGVEPECAQACNRILFECGMDVDWNQYACFFKCSSPWSEETVECLKEIPCDESIEESCGSLGEDT